jgi:flagellar export protein FliJ
MSWRHSLVRLAGYEVEQLRKRLAEVIDRRAGAEIRLALLHAEGEAEARRATADADAGWHHLNYLAGWRVRRDAMTAEIAALEAEEGGARDAVARAFEELKKYEQLEENARLRAAKEEAGRETAALDELGLRRTAAR